MWPLVLILLMSPQHVLGYNDAWSRTKNNSLYGDYEQDSGVDNAVG